MRRQFELIVAVAVILGSLLGAAEAARLQRVVVSKPPIYTPNAVMICPWVTMGCAPDATPLCLGVCPAQATVNPYARY